MIGPDNSAYTVTTRNDGTYAVEIRKADALPQYVEGFKTEEEAEYWIFNRMERTEPEPAPLAGTQDSLPGPPGSRGD